MLAVVALYVLVGVVQDWLIARYYLSLTSGRTVLAPVLGALITVLTVVVFDRLITSHSLIPILAYGLGTGVGTRFGMARHGRTSSL